MVNAVKQHAMTGEFVFQGRGQLLVLRLGVVATRQSGLVRHDDQCIARCLQRSHAFYRAGHEFEVLPAVNIGLVLVDHAIAVQKGSLAQARLWLQGLADALYQCRGGEAVDKRDGDRLPPPAAHHAGFF